MSVTLPQRTGREERNETGRRRFSEVLRSLASSGAERLLFADLLSAFGDRAFGALMFVFAAPNMLPLPPGSSSILGAPLIIVATQLALGRRVMWLPHVVANRSFAMEDFSRFANAVLPWVEKAERFLQPRFPYFFGPLGDRIIGGMCLLMAIILFLPIPFGNMVPAMAVAAFSLALIEKDGIAVMLGWVLSAVGATLVGLFFGLVIVMMKAIFAFFTG